MNTQGTKETRQQAHAHVDLHRELAATLPMTANRTFADASEFALELRRLRDERERRVTALKAAGWQRLSLRPAERAEVLRKAGGRCHICGGTIQEDDWEADHVFAHSAGGAHSVENYLPAHSLCNNYRWHYGTEEFQWILKLGVWLRTQIEKKTPLGIRASVAFTAHELRRAARCKPRRGETSQAIQGAKGQTDADD